MRLRLASACIAVFCTLASGAGAALFLADVPRVLTDTLTYVCGPVMAGVPIVTAARTRGFLPVAGQPRIFRKDVGQFLMTVDVERGYCALEVLTGYSDHPGSAYAALSAWAAERNPPLGLAGSQQMRRGFEETEWRSDGRGRTLVLRLRELPRGPLGSGEKTTTFVSYGYE